MNFYEFGVTQTIDWCDVKTVYVEAESSHEAIKFMLTLSSASNCDRENEKFPFADFKFRTAIPFCCIELGATIYRVTDQ